MHLLVVILFTPPTPLPCFSTFSTNSNATSKLRREFAKSFKVWAWRWTDQKQIEKASFMAFNVPSNVPLPNSFEDWHLRWRAQRTKWKYPLKNLCKNRGFLLKVLLALPASVNKEMKWLFPKNSFTISFTTSHKNICHCRTSKTIELSKPKFKSNVSDSCHMRFKFTKYKFLFSNRQNTLKYIFILSKRTQ